MLSHRSQKDYIDQIVLQVDLHIQSRLETIKTQNKLTEISDRVKDVTALVQGLVSTLRVFLH